MTNPTPLSTASSSDDLVEQLRQVSLTIISAQPQAEWVSALISMAASEIERLRQPVAGDVVERASKILCKSMFGDEAIHGDGRCCQVGGKDGCCLESIKPMVLALEADGIKLIGGGK